ncbi:unnamed protein product [Schistosoma margrebowiei]|uniref:Uncharacterized protein n=1 Tax=Schistosoma margrebowiei TaxID=48269 RepID=A0A183MMQ8_9TREM|nr:unnamed protein product [Schistosoma margrebowiei]
MVEPAGTYVPANIARLGHHDRQARPPRQGDNVGIMAFLPPLGRSDHALILFKFMTEIACQTVAPARPNIWKANMQVIKSAASAENWGIDSKASVQEA